MSEIHFQIQALDERTRLPISNARLQLQNINLGQEALTDSKGIASFAIKESEYLKPFNAKLIHNNYQESPILDRSIIPNAIKRRDKPFELRFLGKLRCYFNGKELQLCRGNNIVESFSAYSGKALNINEKERLQERKYENFVSYKDKGNNIIYFCLDKQWQKQKDKGAIPEGRYYIDINESKDDESSGIRAYKTPFFSQSRSKEKETQWGKYNIPIYTDKECVNVTESQTQRENFFIHGGESYGNNGGIDLAKENNKLVNKLESLRNQLIVTNPHLKDKPIVLELLVDYAPLCISLDSIGLERTINQNANQYKVILIGNYTKPQEIKEEIFNAQKQQTYWGYREISQIEEFNFKEVKIKDLTLFKENERVYKGESLEINLVKYDWHRYNKQIIVFGFLDTDINMNTKGEEVIENPKWRIITWHNPIVNPRVTLFSFYGNNDRIETAMFGEFQGRGSGVHKALDFFAKTGTKLYAPLDGEVVSTSFSSSYGQTINLKVTGTSLEILKIRRAFINYSLTYEDKGEETQGDNFDEEAESYYLFYAHLSKVNVKKGDKVVAGQLIGLSGTSGNAKGTKTPHLHFEIRSRKNGEPKSLNYLVNPAFYIDFKKLPSEFSQEEKQEQQEVCGKDCKIPVK